MTLKYTPAWRNEDGNRIVFPEKNMAFDTFDQAHIYQSTDFIFYIPFGLKMDGIFEMELDENGRGFFLNIKAELKPLGDVLIIDGPMFDKALANAGLNRTDIEKKISELRARA